MANLLNNFSLWTVTGADQIDGVWHMNIDGAHSARPNGNLTTINDPEDGNLVAGTVNYTITDYEPPLDYLYFVVYFENATGFNQLVYSPGDPLPKSGSVNFDVSTDGSGYVSIGMGREPVADPAVNVSPQYISIGDYTITPTIDPEPPVTDCCPKSGSRLFKGIASKYRANQHQPVRARRFQKRCLQVDFSGALEKDETITKVTWECYSPWVTFMQGGCISLDGKRVCVDVTLNYSGIGDVKATVETTSGTVENYEFSITVTDAPMYPSAQYIPSNGPYKIVKEV